MPMTGGISNKTCVGLIFGVFRGVYASEVNDVACLGEDSYLVTLNRD